MADKEHIDSFLKENLGNWEVDAPPDAWLAISKGISASAPAASTAAGTAATKSLLLPFAKITAALLGIGITSFALVTYFSDSTPIEKENNQPLKTEEVLIPETESRSEAKSTAEPTVPARTFVKKSSSPTKTGLGSLNSINSETDLGKSAKPENGGAAGLHDEIPSKKQEPILNASKKQVEKEPEDTKEVEGSENQSGGQFDEPMPIIHTAFSPDGDGVNDELVLEMPPLSFFRIRIFSLKGQLVFETDKPNQFWKGQIGQSGIPAETGNYRFILDYQVKGFEKVRSQTGLIFLAR
ncbi:hypothetical protein MASR2M44_29480 [Bacteroidota bacterium]